MTALDPTVPAGLVCPTCRSEEHRAMRYVVDDVTRVAIVSLRAGVLALAGPVPPSPRPKRPQLECWALRLGSTQRLCLTRWALPMSIVGITWKVAS